METLTPAETENELPLNAALFTVFLCMLFGANAVAIKISLVGMGVFTTAGLRFAIAAVTIFLWALWKAKPLIINKKQALQLFVLALIFFAQMSFFYTGQGKTTASHGTLIANILPFVVMILAHFFLPGDKINTKKVVGLLLGFTGVILLFFEKTEIAAHSLEGDIFILVGVVIWGVNVVYVKNIIKDFHPIQITLYPMIMGLPFYLIAALVLDDKMIHSLTPAVINGLLYQSLVTASFGFLMWNTLIRKYGATALHSFVFILPLSGVFFGVLLLGEPVTLNLIGSIILVTTGLIIVNYRSKKTLGKRSEIR